MIDSSAPVTKSNRYLILLLGLVAFLQVVFLRPGHQWGDDFAHYILQAKHLVTLHEFVAREYIPNPDALNLGPQTLPPGLSVILAPVYAAFGLNLAAMKIVLILIFTGGLYFLDGLFADRLPQPWRYALILLVGLSPYVFSLRDEIETEKAFVALLLLTLWLTKRAFSPTGARSMKLAILIGICVFGMCATRNTGLAILPVFPLLDLLNSRPRRITWFSITIILTAGLLLSPIIILLHTTSGYAHLFNFSPLWIAQSALAFAKRFEIFWWGKDPRWPGNVTLVLVAVLAALGLFRDVRKHVGPAELFLPCYLAVILPYFSPGFQLYLLPLYPLLVGYALIGFFNLAGGWRYRSAAIALGMSAVALLFGTAFWKTNWGPIREGLEDPEFAAVCDFIHDKTVSTEIVVFRKPRLLALLTEHPSTVYPMHLDRDPEPDEIWNYLVRVHASYVVVAHLDGPEFATDPIVDRTLVLHSLEAIPVFSNAHFKIYRLATSGPSIL
jgi:hypothetical protein